MKCKQLMVKTIILGAVFFSWVNCRHMSSNLGSIKDREAQKDASGLKSSSLQALELPNTLICTTEVSEVEIPGETYYLTLEFREASQKATLWLSQIKDQNQSGLAIRAEIFQPSKQIQMWQLVDGQILSEFKDLKLRFSGGRQAIFVQIDWEHSSKAYLSCQTAYIERYCSSVKHEPLFWLARPSSREGAFPFYRSRSRGKVSISWEFYLAQPINAPTSLGQDGQLELSFLNGPIAGGVDFIHREMSFLEQEENQFDKFEPCHSVATALE